MAYVTVRLTGVWRSLVARLPGGQEVLGSSPGTPTNPAQRRGPDALSGPLAVKLVWVLI